MRIWEKELIPSLCRQHLLAQWRESLGCYKAVMGETDGYINHPQTKAYWDAPNLLRSVLEATRAEMLARGWNPKQIPDYGQVDNPEEYRQWQTVEQQVANLRSKGCECKV